MFQNLIFRLVALVIGSGSGLYAFFQVRSVWGYPISLIPTETWIFGGGSFLLAVLLIQRGLTKKHEPKTLTVNTKKCAYCAEEIKVEAKICKHCGNEMLTAEKAA